MICRITIKGLVLYYSIGAIEHAGFYQLIFADIFVIIVSTFSLALLKATPVFVHWMAIDVVEKEMMGMIESTYCPTNISISPNSVRNSSSSHIEGKWPL